MRQSLALHVDERRGRDGRILTPRWQGAAGGERPAADEYGLLLDAGVRRHFHLPPVVSEAASRVLCMP